MMKRTAAGTGFVASTGQQFGIEMPYVSHWRRFSSMKDTITSPNKQQPTSTSGMFRRWRMKAGGGHRGGASFVPLAVVTTVTVLGGMSYWIRQWRQRKLQELDYVRADLIQRKLDDLIPLLERTGLMGITGARSVKDELDHIRRWHIEHDYKGGLVLRDLTAPLFAHNTSSTNDEGRTDSSSMITELERLVVDPLRLARRECYYLYYEITGVGEIKQQIFCRGTTLLIDIMTCLQFWMVYDDELDCRVHMGFRNQADRILEDVIPLLAPKTDQRATIELAGHSLGGATAFIIAAKLSKRGYNVIRMTSVGSPRFCATSNCASIVRSLLPGDTIRVESDTDPVPFLPPFAYHATLNKLWIIQQSDSVLYVPDIQSLPWVDSAFVNFRAMEMIAALGKPHKVPSHISPLRRICSSDPGNREPKTSKPGIG